MDVDLSDMFILVVEMKFLFNYLKRLFVVLFVVLVVLVV